MSVYVFMEFVPVFGACEVLARQEISEILPLNKKQQLVLPVNYKASAVCSFSRQEQRPGNTEVFAGGWLFSNTPLCDSC